MFDSFRRHSAARTKQLVRIAEATERVAFLADLIAKNTRPLGRYYANRISWLEQLVEGLAREVEQMPATPNRTVLLKTARSILARSAPHEQPNN